jgi:hypothetical protein
MAGPFNVVGLSFQRYLCKVSPSMHTFYTKYVIKKLTTDNDLLKGKDRFDVAINLFAHLLSHQATYVTTHMLGA